MKNEIFNNFYLISISVSKQEWHNCIKDFLTPLIKGPSELLIISLNDLHFNINGKEGIEIELGVEYKQNQNVLKILKLYLSSKYKSEDYKIKRLVTKNIRKHQDSKLFIKQIIAATIIDGLGDDMIDNDTLITFALYILLECYRVLPDHKRINIARCVSANLITQAEHRLQQIDHKFYQVKYHTSRDAINEIYADIFTDHFPTVKWLKTIKKGVCNLAEKAKTEKPLVNLFVNIAGCVKDQLDLDSSVIMMINQFVFNVLSENGVEKSIISEPLIKSKAIPVARKTDSNQTKIPLLTYYSPSHESMFEQYFYPSYLKYLSADFELLISKGSQVCNALFEEDRWNDQVKEKIIFVNNFLQSTSEEYFVFSDVDIIFFKNIRDELFHELKDNDMVIQNDSLNGKKDNLCSGFYCCRVNGKTKLFFKNLLKNYNNELSDQQNLNLQIQVSDLRVETLSKKFYNFSYTTGRIWYSGLKIPFPESPIIMYHANYTVGNANKEFLLQTFQEWDNLFFN